MYKNEITSYDTVLFLDIAIKLYRVKGNPFLIQLLIKITIPDFFSLKYMQIKEISCDSLAQ